MIKDMGKIAGWKRLTLAEIAVWGSGGTPKSSNKAYYGGKIPFLLIKDLNDGDVHSSTNTITELGLSNSSAKIVNPDSVLIAMYGSIGKLGINKIPVATNQAIAFTKELSPSVYYLFLFYYLLSIRNLLISMGKGGTQQNISQTILKKIPFPLPPLPEQHRIVEKIEELFTELDHGVAALKKAKEQLKIYRQSVLKWAFEGRLTNHTFVKGELPKSWSFATLSKLGELARGKSKHRPRNDKKLFGGPYPFIQTGEVKAAGHTITSFEKTYSEFGLKQSKLWPQGTLCITIAANIAETAFLGFEGCFPDSIVGFTANAEKVDPLYVFYFFKANQSRLESFAPATAQKNINLRILEAISIPYCTPEEQKVIIDEIESRLSVADNLEKTIEETLLKTEALRQSILKSAFEGRLV
jgi:type I restriction enzyme S subunit